KTATPPRSPTRRSSSRRAGRLSVQSWPSGVCPSRSEPLFRLHRGDAPTHLLLGDVLDVAGDVPTVPPRVDELTGAVAVELVLDLSTRGRALRERASEHVVDVTQVDVHGDRGATERLW